MALLGIDIGATRLKAGLVNETGAVLERDSVATPLEASAFDRALAALVASVVSRGEVTAAGIGCKGIIDAATTKVVTLPGTLHFLEGCLLSERVAPALTPGTPVAADNDAKAALAGEMAWGAARGLADAVLLTLGTGVGGAVVAGGRMLRGARGVAGHLGHVLVSPDGPPCICGSRGCLESVFSAGAIETEAYGVVRRGCDSELTRRFLLRPHELACRDVFECAAGGDAEALRIVSRGAAALGAAIAGMLHAFDPEVVILGGQISEAGDLLFEPVRREVAWRSRTLLGRVVPVVPQQVNDTWGVVGAAALTRLASPGRP